MRKNRLFVLIALFLVGLIVLGLLAVVGVVVIGNIDRAQRAAGLTPTPESPVTTPATPAPTDTSGATAAPTKVVETPAPTGDETATPAPTDTSEPTATPTRVVETPAPTGDETATPTPHPGEKLPTALETDDTIQVSLDNKIDLGELTLSYPDELEVHEAAVINLVLALDPQLASLPPVATPDPSTQGRICPQSGLKYSDTTDLFAVTRAQIRAPGFEVYRQTHAEQDIFADPDTPTVWTWIVVPRKAGQGTIQLRVGVAHRLINPSDPRDSEGAFQPIVITRDIDVTVPAHTDN